MNHIAPLLDPESILLDMSFSSKKKLFEHAGEVFSNRYALKSTDVFSSLFERERLGSTALGHGVAIPHGRIKGLAQAAAAFYRLRTPLEFDAPDNQPVSLSIILLVPKDANETHLQILGELAQLFGDETMRARMMDARRPDEIYALLDAWTA